MKNTFRIILTAAALILTAVQLSAQNKGNRSYNSGDEDDYMENRDSTWGVDFDFSGLDPGKVRMKVLTYKLARIKAYNDSMLMVIKMRNIRERSDSLEQLYDLLSRDTTSSYNAYSFFAGQYHSNLSGIKRTLAAAGWARLEDMSFHYTNFLDFTWKRERLVHDVFIGQGAGKSVSKGDASVSYSYLSPLNYNLGFAVLNTHRVQFYPYAGLSYQSSEFVFANTAQQPFDLGNGLYDSLLKAVAVNKRGVEYKFKKRELIMNYGAELDVHILYSKRKTGFILGFRAGKTLPLIGNMWKLDGKAYSQLDDVNIRDYHLDVVFRIYTRQNGKRGAYYLRGNWWENEND